MTVTRVLLPTALALLTLPLAAVETSQAQEGRRRAQARDDDRRDDRRDRRGDRDDRSDRRDERGDRDDGRRDRDDRFDGRRDRDDRRDRGRYWSNYWRWYRNDYVPYYHRRHGWHRDRPGPGFGFGWRRGRWNDWGDRYDDDRYDDDRDDDDRRRWRRGLRNSPPSNWR